MDDVRTTRRAYLGALGTALAAGVAGCAAFSDSDANATAPNATDPTAESTPTGNATTRAENATARAENHTVRADPVAQSADAAAADDTPSQYTQVYQETIGSVVLIRVSSATGRVSQGSGFVFRDNYIVTNAHVVSDATTIHVRFSRGEWRSASIVGIDPSSDLAVIEVTERPAYAKPLPLVENEPAVGTKVAAIGSPYSLEGSITSGIVSAVNRSIPAPNGYKIPDAIQTDAPVNPGNSGGPLLNLEGEVVGVISSGGGENLAFAVSAALVRRVVPELIADGEYEHATLGVRLRPVTPPIAERIGLDRPRGVLVRRVVPGGPSAGALRRGDIIVAIDGRRIETRQQLSSYLALETSPGDTVQLTVLRNGERRTLSITLGVRPERPGARPTTSR